jgi:hypothetical protein
MDFCLSQENFCSCCKPLGAHGPRGLDVVDKICRYARHRYGFLLEPREFLLLLQAAWRASRTRGLDVVSKFVAGDKPLRIFA